MNNISNAKIFKHLDRVLTDNRPITADVFLNNYCNNLCPYCTYRRWELDAGAKSVAFDDFVTYVHRLVELGVKGIILTGGGEPTIAKDFDKIVSWLDQSNIDYGINTNFNVYKEFNPRYLKVSFDAWDEASYCDSRGVERYNTVVDNIKRFAKYKTPKTKLGIQLLAKSVSAVKRFYAANKSLPVDYISIRPMESTLGSYYANLSDDDELNPKKIAQEIKIISSLDNRVTLNYKWDFLSYGLSKCYAQWSQIAVNESGEVMYCCHKPYQIVGHIMDDDILEKKASAETNMQMCDIPCRLTGPNMIVRDIMSPCDDVNFI